MNLHPAIALHEIVGRSIASLWKPLLLLPVIAGSLAAHAQYSYQLLSFPGAEFTDAFGINNAGYVVGGVYSTQGDAPFGYIYNLKSGKYTPVPEVDSLLGINNPGATVTSIVDDLGVNVCVVRGKNGGLTPFYPPAAMANPATACFARAINSSGKVSGWEIDPDTGLWSGFIYDTNEGTSVEFLPSVQTIAQGIDARGRVIGSVFLNANEAYPGSPVGRYGFLRSNSGAVKFFSVSGLINTRGRGLSDSGKITGFGLDVATFETRAYVATLSKKPGYEEIDDAQILALSPCNPELLPPAGYEAYTDVFGQDIRNDGVVVGQCFDTYRLYGPQGDILDEIRYAYGFIATPD